MSTKQSLMPAIHCQTADYLESALAIYQVRGQISRNQLLSIKQICRRELPATVALDQRTFKGVVYINVNGKPLAEVNTRAKILGVNT